METTRFPQVYAMEIHITHSDDFCKRFGRRVKNRIGGASGTYDATRGYRTVRRVTVPCNWYRLTKEEYNKRLDLIDEILGAYKVNCVIVKDSLLKKEIYHGRGMTSQRRGNKNWNPKTAREYVALAKEKHLDDVTGCQLCEMKTTVIGSARFGHSSNSELFNLYARAWRIMWRQTVEKARRCFFHGSTLNTKGWTV